MSAMSFKSEHRDIDHPMIPLHRLMLNKIKGYGDNVALIDGLKEKFYTYTDLLTLIQKTACGLVKLGMKQGDLVAFYSYNTVEWVIMYWAVMCTGAIITTVNHTYTKYELEKHIRDTTAVYIFTVNELLPNCESVVKGNTLVKAIILTASDKEKYATFTSLSQSDTSLWPRLEQIHVDINDTAYILHSSGTTGLPKGVMISHFNIVANVCQSSHPDMVNPALAANRSKGIQVCEFGVLPFYHAYGMKKILIDGLFAGNKMVVLPKFDPVTFLRCIEKYKVGKLMLVPPMAIFLAKTNLTEKFDLSSVTFASCGAAPLSKQTEDELKRKLNIAQMGQGYGMTEATCGTITYSYNMPRRPGSSGKLLPSAEAMIVDPTSGKALGPNQTGEIWLRGPNVMKGYFNNAEATRNTIDKDGWLHTGDVAYYDDDKYVYIVDRIKELIKVKGFQVAPAELEALLLSHPAVSDVGVVGVKDERDGELPRAFVVKKTNTSVTEKEIYDFVSEKTATFKHLKGGVFFTNEIPRLPSGKIIRRDLRNMGSSKI